MTRWRPIATSVICLAGIGLAAFLTWGHYFDQAAITNSCPGRGLGGGSFIDCGAVTTSPESVILGIPVALYGLGYFVVMLALCLPRAWRSPLALVARGRVVLSAVGMAFVLYLVSVEFLQVDRLCLYCTGVHLLQFILFMLVLTGLYDTGYAHAVTLDPEGDDDDESDNDDETSERRLLDA